MFAAQNCNSDIVELLLKEGANPLAVDNLGKRVIDYTVKNHNLRHTNAMKTIERNALMQSYSLITLWAVLITLAVLFVVGVRRARVHN